jgi:hypothetical protein
MAVQHTFQHVTMGERFGKKLYASGSTIEPGNLVTLTSGSLCSLSDPGDAPFGFAFGLRYSIYRPDKKYFDDKEEMAVIQGVGKVLASSDFFLAGTMPVAGETIYAAANGLMVPGAGANKVGLCIRVEQRIDPSGGTGVTQDLALIHYNIPVV